MNKLIASTGLWASRKKKKKYNNKKTKSQIQIQKNVKFSLKQGSDKSGLIDWVNWISGKPQASKPNSNDLLILCLYLYLSLYLHFFWQQTIRPKTIDKPNWICAFIAVERWLRASASYLWGTDQSELLSSSSLLAAILTGKPENKRFSWRRQFSRIDWVASMGNTVQLEWMSRLHLIISGKFSKG